MKINYQTVNNLKISSELVKFVNEELLKDTNISSEKFWTGFDKYVHELAPKNKEFLNIREDLQKKIDNWHIKNKGQEININDYKKFLKDIGYLKNEGADFKIETSNVDDEIAKIAGPQLVVPIMNARYALNAANARWVSLYDSLYGTNIIESEEGGSERYDPNRGQEVIKYVREFFDKFIPIDGTSWKNIAALKVINKDLVIFKDDYEYKLNDKNKFIGHRGDANKPEAIILKNNNLHFEIIINPKAFSAAHDIAGISDVIAESAVSTICDNEDSVAAVDAEDKVICYRNWLGLMKGDLKIQFEKNGKNLERKLNPDRSYISRDGKGLKLHG
ncbi:malate synthase G, partial [Pelagibacterales bacterium SAG-MED30]|nr:malate synthase G [Pelagibacterales bacterium SAG-MED30]